MVALMSLWIGLNQKHLISQKLVQFLFLLKGKSICLLGKGNTLLETAKENKERYQQEMEVYKQKKEEEVACLKKEDEFMKTHKVEALQLLKEKVKADNIIKANVWIILSAI